MIKKKPEITPFVLGILFFVCAVMFISTGIQKHQEYQVVKEDLITIPARVSSISVLEDSDGADSYTACVTYTYNSTTYKDKGWRGMSKGEYGIGQEVEITLNPSAPEMPYTYTGEYWGFIAGAFGFALVGCGFVVFSFRLKKEE